MSEECKIIKDYGVIADHGDLTLELKLISWYGNEPKYDIRAYRKGVPQKGMVFTLEDIKQLGSIIDEYLKTKAETKTETISNVDTKLEEKTKNNIIQLPLPKPDIEKLVTEGNATYEQCEEKINAQMKIYVDPDSQYVLNGVLELCKVDQDFRNNVMREDKHFGGALEYMMKMCRDGYGYKLDNNCGFMDRDMGLGFTIDYFNLKPEEKKPVVQITKVEPKKRGRKKKEA